MINETLQSAINAESVLATRDRMIKAKQKLKRKNTIGMRYSEMRYAIKVNMAARRRTGDYDFCFVSSYIQGINSIYISLWVISISIKFNLMVIYV